LDVELEFGVDGTHDGVEVGTPHDLRDAILSLD